MDNLLSAYYSDKQVDAVLSPYDGLSIGILSSLKGVGYGSGDQAMPVVTGQDAEIASIKSILAGEQTSTVFKDTRELARVAVDMVDALLQGGEVPVNDTETYDNGVKTRAVVPAGAGQRRRFKLQRSPRRQRLLHRRRTPLSESGGLRTPLQQRGVGPICFWNATVEVVPEANLP